MASPWWLLATLLHVRLDEVFCVGLEHSVDLVEQIVEFGLQLVARRGGSRSFLDGLRTTFTCGDYFFVHAGVRPGVPLEHQREEDEEAAVYPVVAKLMGGEDPMSSMARAHVEIDHLARVYQQLLNELPPEGPGADDLMDLRRVLYGLHAILRLHFAQEEETYAWLASEEPDVVV